MICPTGKHGHSTHLHVLHTNEFTENLEFLPAALDRSQIANLASYHHRPDTPQQQLIAKADRLSSGMECQAYEDDAPAGRHFFRRVRLQSVASTVAPPDAPEPQRACLPLAPLCPEDAFPLPTVSNDDLTEQYHRLWDVFLVEWKENRCADPLPFINRATSVLERFTWCIPSATNAVPDISLFDHLRTTAAIAVCLHLAAESTDCPFLLVAADLTGIQKYIYDIRPGSGGLARRLRARSFQVAAYLESVSLGLLDRLQLPIAQRILFAGGKFYLLLPNTRRTAQILDQARIEVSEWLFDTSAGEMGLALASMPIAEDGLTNFPATLHCVNSKLARVPRPRGEAVLAESGGWRESRFLLTAR